MDLNLDQPIAALASPPGGSLRGIVRISGRNVDNLFVGWFEPDANQEWSSANRASSYAGRLVLDDLGQRTECPVQLMYWPNRRSYTGQPLIELHLPGSPCLLETVLGEVYQRGARPARPGEFTMRAFLAGKLDLLQAEAVLGVIDAQSEVELQTALAQLAGGVSGRLTRLRHELLELLADIEAGLDFVDEDIEFVSRHEVVYRLRSGLSLVDDLLQQTSDRMQSRVLPKVVLAGLPNAGKSTLFNRLAGSNSALVSPEQGTTRDFLTRSVTWENLSIELIDTAGWDEQCDGVSQAAQRQRSSQIQQADLLLWCSSSTLDPSEQSIDVELFQHAGSNAVASLRLLTKCDLATYTSARVSKACTSGQIETDNPIPVSAVTGAGLSELRLALQEILSTERSGNSQWLGMTAARCREALQSVADSLARASATANERDSGDELIAVDLREALDHLGVILGAVYTDDILDRIFSKFCIGK